MDFNRAANCASPPAASVSIVESGAVFDTTTLYRYSLWRRWSDASPSVAFVMLNPSTADASKNDPTIRCCVRFAQVWGFGSLEVVNLFAYRTANPPDLRSVADPVGSENDVHLQNALNRADRIILAWGNWGNLHQRDRVVLKLLSHYKNVYCLGLNRSGQPRHPLYIKRDTAPLPFNLI